jgi:hypothetical protein
MIGYRDMMIGDMMIKTDSLEFIESQATKNTLYKVGRTLLGPVSRTTPLISPNCVSTTNQLHTSVEFFQYIPGVRSTNSPMILILFSHPGYHGDSTSSPVLATLTNKFWVFWA